MTLATKKVSTPQWCLVTKEVIDELCKKIDDIETSQPAVVIPLADNEADASIRTGQVWTSNLYARQDHNHPIRRQSNPWDPTLTYLLSNWSTAPQSIILDRWSDEESYTYEWRVRMDIQPWTGRNYITIPNIAWFQRPEIVMTGTYRSSWNPQRDTAGTPANAGAMPTAPYMWNEACHWSSTQRVYVWPYRKDFFGRYYVWVKVRYTRA